MTNSQFVPSTATGLSRLLCLLIAILTISGCASSRMSDSRATLPANLIAPCADIPVLAGSGWDDVGQAYIDLMYLYGECSARHEAVVRAVQAKK